ncbi:MAG: hypothetical protein HYZ16_08980 [Bacteroidetes bacterium]|jgi:hypothetical protein|nr:hypothetical protein [Bacteroidota bacterium]
MKLLLDIKDDKVSMLMELLKELRFVKKITPLTDAKSDLLQKIHDAVNEMNLIKQGKLVSKPLKEFLNEL